MSTNVMKSKLEEEIFDYIIKEWQNIVNYAHSSSPKSKKRDVKGCITDSRPSRRHLVEFVKRKYPDLSEEEIIEILSDLSDYRRLIYYQSHFKLGVEGATRYIKHHGELGYWNADKVLKEMKEKNRIFQIDPDELAKELKQKDVETAQKRKRNAKLKKSGSNITRRSSRKKKPQKSGIEKPKQEKLKTENDKKITKLSVEPKTVPVENKNRLYRPPIKDKNGEIKEDLTPVEVEEEKEEKEKETLVSDIEEILDESEEELTEMKEDKTEKKTGIDTDMSMYFDSDYGYIISVLSEVKSKNKGMPMSEKQILEHALKIDPNFANKFFIRIFRMTPIPEILKIRPSSFLM